MTGIYLTQQGKEEIEAAISRLEAIKKHTSENYEWNTCVTEQNILKKVLSSATVIPIEENWNTVGRKSIGSDYGVSSATQEKYPNGVIIKSTK